jgi:cytochrome c oxidase subunit 4
MSEISQDSGHSHQVPPAVPGDFAPATPPPHSNEEFGGHPAHGVGHVVSMKVLGTVFGALVLLTVITVAASYVNFGEANLIVALAIAVLKASLVVLYFMHLRWDRPFNSIVFVGCLIFVALFIGLAMLDTQQYHPSVWNQQAPKVEHQKLLTTEGESGAVERTGVAPAGETGAR